MCPIVKAYTIQFEKRAQFDCLKSNSAAKLEGHNISVLFQKSDSVQPRQVPGLYVKREID